MSVVVLSACSPGIDFWGNPVPSEEPAGPTCAQPEAPPPIDPHYDKPPDTPPGHNWVTYGLSVLALDQDLHNDYCIPIEVTYTKSVVDPDLVMDNRAALPQTVTIMASTPWQGFVSFDYDPSLDRFQGRPPTYKIDLRADYLVKDDKFHPTNHVAMACRIQIQNAPIVQDIAISPGRYSCHVEFQDNLFHVA